MIRKLLFAAALTIFPPCVLNAQPTVEQFKQVMNAQLQKLKGGPKVVRTVLFQNVRAGRANGGRYPFEVTAVIHDYDPGYPPNRYYGQTCIGEISAWPFDMLKNDMGDWMVQGRMTADAKCTPNKTEGVASVPLASLKGESAAPGMPASTPASAADRAQLYLGEYACYGVGSRLMAGMGFKLEAGGKYAGVDGTGAGTYVRDVAAATITFHGGKFDGQVARNVKNTGFQLSQTVSCEPWR
ncbi:MAG TPA: hypothetical protein VE967_02265 [Gemmatimonadaceae bacterium]|nr:hypothetical protein [Gemmatimonadaceae bacterium]